MRPILITAADLSDIKEVEILLQEGHDINQQDMIGYTPLHYAAERRNPQMVRLLLEKGANPNIKANFAANHGTALHIAVTRGCYKVVKLLIDAGANVDEKTSAEETPLVKAVTQGNVNITRILLEKGANPLVKVMANCTIVEFALKIKNLAILLLMRKRNNGYDEKTYKRLFNQKYKVSFGEKE